MSAAKTCREHARICQRKANNKTISPALRQQWLELAYHWQLCADYQEDLFSDSEAEYITVH